MAQAISNILKLRGIKLASVLTIAWIAQGKKKKKKYCVLNAWVYDKKRGLTQWYTHI